MRYALVFFPFVGIIIGLLAALWQMICGYAGTGDICRVCILAAIPLGLAYVWWQSRRLKDAVESAPSAESDSTASESVQPSEKGGDGK